MDCQSLEEVTLPTLKCISDLEAPEYSSLVMGAAIWIKSSIAVNVTKVQYQYLL